MSTPHRETVSREAARSLGRSWGAWPVSRRTRGALSLVAGLVCAVLFGAGCRSTRDAADAPARSASADAAAAASALELTNIDPVFQPALESLHAAVRAGDDDTASAILAHVLSRAPRGRALALARAYERILAGRAAVRALALTLELVDVEDGGAPRDLRELVLAVRNTGDVALVLAPGPAALSVAHERLDARGDLSVASDTKSFENLGRLELAPGAETRVPLSVYFLELTPGSIAERLRFRLELRASSIEDEGRELPAMRLRVGDAEALALSDVQSAKGAASPGALVDLANSGHAHTAEALDLAVRVAREERAPLLDQLAQFARTLTDTDLKELVPALRWLDPTTACGGEPAAWREWLLRRAHAGDAKDRGTLVLPPLAR